MFLHVGVSPEELLVRVNDTFTISCLIDIANGELDFYDGDALVPNSSIQVRKLILSERFNCLFLSCHAENQRQGN